MNQMTLKGNWNELKGKAREKWGKLTSNDLDQIQGRSEQLEGKIQRAYGLSQEEARRQVEEFEEDCGCGHMRARSAADDEPDDEPVGSTEVDDENVRTLQDTTKDVNDEIDDEGDDRNSREDRDRSRRDEDMDD